MKVRFSRQAREDLLDIWTYIAAENEEAADRLFDRIENACRRLGDNPRLGVSRPALGDGARVLIVRSWLVLYRLRKDDIQIVRVLHGARDLSRLQTGSST